MHLYRNEITVIERSCFRVSKRRRARAADGRPAGETDLKMDLFMTHPPSAGIQVEKGIWSWRDARWNALVQPKGWDLEGSVFYLRKRSPTKADVYRVIEDQVDLPMVGYGMGVRRPMHPSSMHFRVVDLRKRKKGKV